ncbi:FxSxx-COOH system tetratricopeptide repeat protein [Dactylosporangium sp. NPDC000521]|uniref:FxSxx-COOH system tetratricopeptide repeat protein n=1 Tax=Dactylosporangium sp. NPDC000521 TaxID=3363975 RepID=UPI00367B811D
MSAPHWWVYRGDGTPHAWTLPEAPPWRRFSGRPPQPPPGREEIMPAGRSGSARNTSRTVLAMAYRAEAEEVRMVNAAIHLRRPLLVTGSPGTGKSTLAYSLAHELDLDDVLYWPVNSRTTLHDGLYRYDAIARLQDASLAEKRRHGDGAAADPSAHVGRYLTLGPLGTALLPGGRPRVLLIDELDKGDVDLPNDLLTVFEEGQYTVPELQRLTESVVSVGTDDGGVANIANGLVRCAEFPIVIITSNGERQFPPAFLRRCVRLQLGAPPRDKLERIITAHLGPDALEPGPAPPRSSGTPLEPGPADHHVSTTPAPPFRVGDAPGWRPISASPVPAGGSSAVVPAGGADSLNRRTIDARVARDRPLPHREQIARALLPLRRSVAAGAGMTVDEPATAQHVAHVGTMTPVLRPLRERWLEVAIVVDCSSTMRLWQQTARALRGLAERRGAFRDVRTYRLDSDAALPGLVDDGGNPHHYRELSDHAGRRLVLVLTDGVGHFWRTPAARVMLAGWARRNPVAIVQVLPQAIWHRTALPPATVVLRSAAPGRITSVGQGQAGAPWVPVVPLRAAPMEAWARLLAGHEVNGIPMPAVPVGHLPAATIAAELGAAPTPREQVARFQSSASPAAFALAGRLAAAPLTLPLMRAIQNVLHPESGLDHLAEILLSGLLVQIPAAGADDDVQYEFRRGIREELLRTRSRRDAYSVLETLRDIAPFVPNPYGSLDVWALSAEPDAELGEHRQGRRFAEVAITVLGGLGGRYVDMADRIRSSLTGIPPVPARAATVDVLVSYAATDQTWADWVRRQLVGAGVRTALHEISADAPDLTTVGQTFVLLSAGYAAAPHAGPFWRRLQDHTFLPFRIDAGPLPAPFDWQAANLSHRTAVEAYRLVFELSGRTPDRDWQDPGDPRYPLEPPPVWNVPERDGDFIGRDDLLHQVRARLAARTIANPPHALLGLAGIGKTHLAVEYAHRFAAHYDTVWWVAAEQEFGVRASLAELGAALNIEEELLDDTVGLVRDALRRRGRWLLILDDAASPQEVAPLLPEGPGDVLVTSRDQDWAGWADAVQIGAFTTAESTTLLNRQVGDLTFHEAETVADRVGDLPIALRQAGNWLAATGMPVSQFLQLLDDEPLLLLDEDPPAGYPGTVATIWRLSLRRLQMELPAAMKLLEICAFFAAEPIPVRLLRAERCLQQLLAYDDELSDPARYSLLIRQLGKDSLVVVDPGGETVTMHRLVQLVVQDGSTGPEREAHRRLVHQLLATAKRGSPAELEAWPVYALLAPHVRGTQAHRSDDLAVRQLVLDVVRYLYASGNAAASMALAEDAAEAWRTSPIDDRATRLLLDYHRANALRAQGQFDRAANIGEPTYRMLRDELGPRDANTIMAASGVAADLRARGRFAESLALAEESLAGAQDAFGQLSEPVLTSMADVAWARRMLGQFARAADIDAEVSRARQLLLGADHPLSLLATTVYGHDLLDLGLYEEARETLRTVLIALQDQLGASAPATLRAATSLAATLRAMGRVQEARQLTDDTLPRCRGLLGDLHIDTLASLTNQALEAAALGDGAGARTMAQEALTGYEELFGERHPLRFIALSNLAAVAPDDALGLAEQASDGLRLVLGPRHPYTLMSEVNLANATFDAGDAVQANLLDNLAWTALRGVLGDDHPASLAAAANFVASGGPAARLRDDALAGSLRHLGDGHPVTVALREGLRCWCAITPPAI